jgi:hypothetical protein
MGRRITGDAIRMNLDKAKALFPSAASKLESPNGPIHMLIGMDHMKDAPREQDRVEGISQNSTPGMWLRGHESGLSRSKAREFSSEGSELPQWSL